MELAARAAALCVTAALMTLILRQGGAPALGLALVLGTAACVLVLLAGPAGELYAFFLELGARSGLSMELLRPLYKTLGIALVVRIGGDLCRDAGESALAAAVETAGAVCALLAALPLLRAVLGMLAELME